MFKNSYEAKGYLSAIIDGEGTVFVGPSTRYVSICNTSTGIITRTKLALDYLGIKYTTHDRKRNGSLGKKKLTVILVSRQIALRRLCRMTDLADNEKHSKLELATANIKKFPPYGQIVRLYSEGKTDNEIADYLNKSVHSIRYWKKQLRNGKA